LHADIALLKPNGPSPDDRYDSYVPRLIANILADTKQSLAEKAKAKKP